MSGVRSLGLDVGSRRVGVALSDPDGAVAVGHGVIELPTADTAGADPAAVLDGAVTELVSEFDVDEIVVGLPLRTDGSEGPEATAVRHAATRLGELTGLPVALVDERFTTRIAHDAGRAAGANGRRRRGTVDRAAATLILQAHLDRRRGGVP
jgi:putative Holliday junction resolvase